MLDILLLHPRFNTFSRGFTEEYSRRRFPFVRPLFDSFLIGKTQHSKEPRT